MNITIDHPTALSLRKPPGLFRHVRDGLLLAATCVGIIGQVPGVQAQAPSPAKTPPAAAAPSKSVEAVVVHSDWTWGGTDILLHFDENHTGSQIGKVTRQFKWEVTADYTVQLTITDGGKDKKSIGSQATLVFRNDGSGYAGTNLTNRKFGGKRVDPSPAPGSAAQTASTKSAPSTPVPKPPISQLANFADQISVAAGWALAPLHVTVPREIRENTLLLKAGLTAESGRRPAPWQPVYARGLSLADLVIGTLQEKEALFARAASPAGAGQWNLRAGQIRTILVGADTQFREAWQAMMAVPDFPGVGDPAIKLAKLPPVPKEAPAPATEAKSEKRPEGLVINRTGTERSALDAVVQSIEVADLGGLFGGHGKPREDLAPHPKISVFHEITYLMPRVEAEKKLGGDIGFKSRSQIGCSGFPGGLTCFSYDVKIDVFNRVLLVVDQAEQVVAVELIAQHSFNPPLHPRPGNWHTIDYCNQEVKGTPRMDILTQYPVLVLGQDAAVTAVSFSTTRYTAALFVPQPMIDLILLCVEDSQKRPR